MGADFLEMLKLHDDLVCSPDSPGACDPGTLCCESHCRGWPVPPGTGDEDDTLCPRGSMYVRSLTYALDA